MCLSTWNGCCDDAEEIRDLEAGAAYPGYLLEGCETALVLFAAGFLGKQDALWIAEAGLGAVCVDEDETKMLDMAKLYPRDWMFVVADVYGFAHKALHSQWDIVSLDPWTRDFQKTADHIQLWCDLARRGVILGTGWNTKVEPPDGWKLTDVRKRSDYDGGVYWTILEPV